MTPVEVYKEFASAIAHIVVTDATGQRISSGTGFMVGDRLVTCAHCLPLNLRHPVEVLFRHPVETQHRSWKYPNGVPQMTFLGRSEEHSFDFAIVSPPEGAVLSRSLAFTTDEPEVGEEVYGLGYPFDQEELTLTRGIISSDYKSGVARFLKLDMSVNPSNSGGPLIRASDGSVCGVIARKSTGLSKAFDGLIASIDSNIRALQNRGGMRIMGIDPIEALTVSQNQMRTVVADIQRSAQVGIGHAVFVDPLRDEAAFFAS